MSHSIATRWSTILVAVTALVLMSSSALWSVETDAPNADPDAVIDDFARQYGDAFQQALGTRSNADDLTLAKKLIADGPRYRKDQAMLILVGRRAYQLASTEPADFNLAQKALEMLVRYAPDRRLEWKLLQVGVLQRVHLRTRSPERQKVQQRLLEAYESVGDLLEQSGEFYKALVFYRRAMNLLDSLDSSASRRLTGKIQTQPYRQRTQLKLNRLLTQLKANPKDRSAARAIVDVYIVELNDPKSAKAYADLFTGRQKRNVELADANSSKLSDEDAWELAMWYQAYADTAMGMYRPPLLARARELFKRFLRSPSKGDPRVSMAYARLHQVDKQIRDLPDDLRTPRVNSSSGKSKGQDEQVWKEKRDKEREKERERERERAANSITIEAERADQITHPFQIQRDGDASGGTFGAVPSRIEPQNEQMSKPSPGRIVFYVNVPQRTTADISGRVRALPNSFNSFFVSVAPGRDTDAKMRSWVFNTSPNKWQWTRYGKVKLEAGVNTIVVAGREAGSGIDAIRITPRD